MMGRALNRVTQQLKHNVKTIKTNVKTLKIKNHKNLNYKGKKKV